MKRWYFALLPFLLFFAACKDPLRNGIVPLDVSGVITEGKGRVVINREDSSARTLLPEAPEFVSYSISFQYKGGFGASMPDIPDAAFPCSVELPPGPWLITVTAYTHIEGVAGLSDGEYPAASDSTEVTVESSVVVNADFNLMTGIDLDGKGVLEYSVGLPEEGLGGAVLRVLKMDTSEVAVLDLLENASGTIVLDAGYYLLQVETASGRLRIKTELLHIYSGHTTSAEGSGWNFNTQEGEYLSLDELSEFLSAAPQNTADNPYPVKLNVDLGSLAASDYYRVVVLGALFNTLNTHGKYAAVDLSGATGTLAVYNSNPDNAGYYSAPAAGRDKLVSVTLPEGLTAISPVTFSNCASLKTVNIPASLKKIGANAFAGSTNLLLNIPDNSALQSIASGVFTGCDNYRTSMDFSGLSSLAVIDLSGYTQLEQVDFSGCESLIGANLKFTNCAALTRVSLPLTIGTVPPAVFSGCNALDTLVFSGSQETAAINLSPLNFKTADFSTCANLTVIESNAFTNCVKLEKVSLPDSITAINENAFKGCTALQTISAIPNIEIIANSAFEACTALFSDTKSLDLSLYPALASIGDNAFGNCTQFTTLVLPPSIQTLGAAFAGCTGITGIDLSVCAGLKAINGTFDGLSGLVSVILPAGLETIGENSFKNTAITAIEFPSSITAIGNNAFYGCVKLEALDLSACTALTSIGVAAFQNCASLTSADLSGLAMLKSIGASAFNDSTLASILLTGCAALETIGNYAFRQTALESIDLSDCIALTSINDWTFYGCYKLSLVDLSGLSMLKSIGYQAFSYSGVTSIDLTDCAALETIGHYAFNNSAIVSVNLADCAALVGIGNSVFQDCAALASVDLSGCTALKTIGEGVFINCVSLTEMDFSGLTSLERIGSDMHNLHPVFGGSAVKSIDLSGCASLVKVNFSSYDKLETVNLSGCASLQTINSSMFTDCPSLVSLNLSNCAALTAVDFSNIASLGTVNLSGCIALVDIGNSAFSGCTNLGTVNFSLCVNLKTFGDSVFANCTSLVSIDLNGCTMLTNLGDYAFQNCASLVSMDLSGFIALTDVGNYAFQNCVALKSVDFSGCTSFTSCDGWDFEGCNGVALDLSGCTSITTISSMSMFSTVLASVNLSGCTALTRIETAAFLRDSALTTVNLSGCTALTSIGNGVFHDCTSMTTLDLSGVDVPPKLGSESYTLMPEEIVFSGYNQFYNSPVVIYVSPEKLSEYKSAAGWSNYASKIQPKQ